MFVQTTSDDRSSDDRSSDPALDAALEVFCVRQADRALVLAQRLLEMVTHAPEIEEDMALSNLALDLIGQARALYTRAGEVAATPDTTARTEDDYAFTRDDVEFTSPLLVEQPNHDFAYVIARQYLHDVYALELWSRLRASADEGLRAIAERATKETEYHLRHSRGWLLRLGDGTAESRRRMSDAIDWMWRYTGELFERDQIDDVLIEAGMIADPADIRDAWSVRVSADLAEATLDEPSADAVMATGSRIGRHGEGFSYLIEEMQVVARADPGARW